MEKHRCISLFYSTTVELRHTALLLIPHLQECETYKMLRGKVWKKYVLYVASYLKTLLKRSLFQEDIDLLTLVASMYLPLIFLLLSKLVN